MKEFFEFMDLLNKYSSLILMFATLIYVYFTYRLTKETTKLREVETTPFMSIYIKPTSLIEMVIENIGKAPAYNVKISIDEKYLECFLFDCTKHEIFFSYFSPNQKLKILMKQYSKLETLKYDRIPIKANYQSKEGRVFEEIFHISWKSLSSTVIQTNKLEDIKRELEKVIKEIAKLGKIINEKEYFVTNKLKILEFKLKDDDLDIIFSNGVVKKINIEYFEKNVNVESVEKLTLINGNLVSYQEGLIFLAEEVYALLKSETNV